MRCIEMHLAVSAFPPAGSINSNMRCIEMKELDWLKERASLINSNMRCIEMADWIPPDAPSLDKQ